MSLFTIIMGIIGYIHICQKPGWQRSFDMIFEKIVSSGLYEKVDVIRLSVLSDDGVFADDEFHKEKCTIIYRGRSEEYERPTLLHIRASAQEDSDSTYYFYVHTKGLRHFGTHQEDAVLDWIRLLIYWNIEHWKMAIVILSKPHYWTYGCNHTGIHYSGNFWWSKPSHIRRLSDTIPDYYTAPEDWATMLYWGQDRVPIHREYYSIFNSGLEGMGHYTNRFPESEYRIS